MKNFRTLLFLPASIAGALLIYGLAQSATPGDSPQLVDQNPAARQVFFGELHLHTGNSFDAYSFMGARTTPDEALRFARGEPINYLGQSVQRPRPLDFAAVTDHAEYIGVIKQMGDPHSTLARSELGQRLREHPFETFMQIARGIDTHQDAPELNAVPAMAEAWQEEIQAANQNYRPGSFTTFIAYEWSAMADKKKNMHRNVIFRNAPADAPFSASDSQRPEDLWNYLEQLRARGIEVLAIPHNANASGGLMFDWNDSDGRPINEAYAQRRAFNEPLTEVYQIKGQSETVPELSAADEFSDFEVMDQLLAGGASPVNGSYVRQALGRGLEIQSKVGANPFKLGFVGGSDSHSGLTNSDENAYAGQSGILIDPNKSLPSADVAASILAKPAPGPEGGRFTGLGRLSGSAGLTGVWAESNTRESIYAALRRRETFATSGPTLRLRFFAGWDISSRALKRSDWVARAYSTGVPMGSDLPTPPAAAHAPGFIVQAMKDPNNGNLDRIQIVKVWLQNGTYQEKVYDVVWSSERKRARGGRVPPVRNTVDLTTATYSNTVGAATLSGVWRDPAFDRNTPAVYYARAIEIPTPRWNTILAVKRNLPLPPDMPATLQERAVSSPIWYTPAAPR